MAASHTAGLKQRRLGGLRGGAEAEWRAAASNCAHLTVIYRVIYRGLIEPYRFSCLSDTYSPHYAVIILGFDCMSWEGGPGFDARLLHTVVMTRVMMFGWLVSARSAPQTVATNQGSYTQVTPPPATDLLTVLPLLHQHPLGTALYARPVPISRQS